MKMNKRKKIRRIAYLMSTLNPMYAETWKRLKGWEHVKKDYEKYSELEALTKEMTSAERYDVWLETYRTNNSRYTKLPKLERKDNKTYINRGSGNSNRNKIRYPKKVRKTAWKRFYKLFPKLNPNFKSAE